MPRRCMYIWKLAPIIDAEGGVNSIVDKAKRAKLSAIWVKVAEGVSPYANVTGSMAAKMTALVARAHNKNLEVWGWHVPHCATPAIAQAEATAFGNVVQSFRLDGLIMDAEGTGDFFHGGVAEARTYATAMRTISTGLGKPLAISSNDIPQNIAGWLPKFTEIAEVADLNFPQTYYGASSSVASRVDRAETGNAHVTIPFCPVGAGFIGLSQGGCASAQACAERASIFIRLCKDRGYQSYSFWHWGGAPLPLWEVLNNTAA